MSWQAAKRSIFVNGSSFEPLGSFWSRMLRRCHYAVSTQSLRGHYAVTTRPSRAVLGSFLAAYARGCVQIRFMNGSSLSQYSHQFGRICCVVRSKLTFRRIAQSFEPMSFHKWLKFRRAWIILVAMLELRPDSIHEWLKFRAVLVAHATWLRSRFGFMSQSNAGSDRIDAVAMLAVRQELESQVQQAR